MIVFIICSIVILACLIILGVIIFCKLPKLKAIDLEAMKQHREAQVKVSIVEERLERKMTEFKNKSRKWLLPIKGGISSFINGLYRKTLNLQKKYKEKNKTENKTQESLEMTRQKINKLIFDAQELTKQEKYIEAEKKYIEAISLDKQNVEPYKGLADLYILKKDYQPALETLEFIQKINPNDEVIWRQTGDVCNNLNDIGRAVKCYKRVVDIMPNNPKNLDILIGLSIKAKDKYLAQSTLQKFEEVNPENNKIADYKEKLKSL